MVVHEEAGAPLDRLRLALQYGLSSYDAEYLALAMRLNLPLATRDDRLREAARAAGVGVVESGRRL